MEPANSNLKFNSRGAMRRGVYILPSLFTVGTLVCGYYAIIAALRGSLAMAAGGVEGMSAVAFDEAARAIGWAILFDGLDGRIARLTNSTSAFGREFDSLADVITFGVAPAILAYSWGIRAINESMGPPLIEHLRQIGWVVTFAYVICGTAGISSACPFPPRRERLPPSCTGRRQLWWSGDTVWAGWWWLDCWHS
ncbi:MAG: CDP-alcohol phosphatidyltransferase family protein [Terriglobia bacterium]